MKALVVLAIARSRPHAACLRRVGTFADHDLGRVLPLENSSPRGRGHERVLPWCKRRFTFSGPDFE